MNMQGKQETKKGTDTHMQEQQLFQSRAQLIALKVHGYWEKFENVVLYPFRWIADQLGQTHVFRQAETQLKLVKRA